MTKARLYPTTPLDPDLKVKMLKIIEASQRLPTEPASDSISDHFAALIPTAMSTFKGLIEAYEKGELSPALQKKIITEMKTYVRQYKNLIA